MKKLLFLPIMVLLLSGCAAMIQNYCQTSSAYSAGVNDGQYGRYMQSNYASICPVPRQAMINASYRRGFNFGASNPRPEPVPVPVPYYPPYHYHHHHGYHPYPGPRPRPRPRPRPKPHPQPRPQPHHHGRRIVPMPIVPIGPGPVIPHHKHNSHLRPIRLGAKKK